MNVIYSNIACPTKVSVELTQQNIKISTSEGSSIATINFINNLECIVMGTYFTFTIITPAIQMKFNCFRSWLWRIKIQYILEQFESRSIFTVLDQVKKSLNNRTITRTHGN